MQTKTTSTDQMIVFFLCMADMIFFLYYLVNSSAGNKYMITDQLFASPDYRVLLTIFLAARLTLVIIYVTDAYRNRSHQNPWLIPGFLGPSVAFAGWCWLITHKEDTSHITGVAIFCVGTFIYSAALIRLAHMLYPGHKICVVIFSIMYFDDEVDAFIPEHMAYIFFLLFYTIFFVNYPPNICCKHRKDDEYERAQCRVPSQCMPLLPLSRAPIEIVHETI
jgi:hypothetical protein